MRRRVGGIAKLTTIDAQPHRCGEHKIELATLCTYLLHKPLCAHKHCQQTLPTSVVAR